MPYVHGTADICRLSLVETESKWEQHVRVDRRHRARAGNAELRARRSLARQPVSNAPVLGAGKPGRDDCARLLECTGPEPTGVPKSRPARAECLSWQVGV